MTIFQAQEVKATRKWQGIPHDVMRGVSCAERKWRKNKVKFMISLLFLRIDQMLFA